MRRNLNSLAATAAALAALLGGAWLALAAVEDTQTIPYTGRLELDGSPVTGMRAIDFALFDVPTAGTARWTGAYMVQVVSGRFAVELGGSGQPIPNGVFSAPELFLEVSVGGTILQSRQALRSVPFARSLERVGNGRASVGTASECVRSDGGHDGDFDGDVALGGNSDGNGWPELQTFINSDLNGGPEWRLCTGADILNIYFNGGSCPNGAAYTFNSCPACGDNNWMCSGWTVNDVTDMVGWSNHSVRNSGNCSNPSSHFLLCR